MISVIICSAKAIDLALVSKNIEETIGIPHEIIAINNHKAEKGLCEVYNEAVALAKYDILCYMHEDVKLLTQEWGQTVVDIFVRDGEIGVIGVAGGGYKALAPSGWYCVEFQHPDKSFQNILQGYKLDSKEEIHAYHNPHGEKLTEVVCIDGVWFCTKKQVVRDHPFDQALLKGFHGYDIDFCLKVYGKHKIVVTYNILMKHASEGNFNKLWLDQILKLHKKWSKNLPLTTAKVSDREIYFTEKRALRNLVEQMLEWEYSFWEIHRMLFTVAKSKRMPLRLFFKGYIHLLEQRFGTKPSAE